MSFPKITFGFFDIPDVVVVDGVVIIVLPCSAS